MDLTMQSIEGGKSGTDGNLNNFKTDFKPGDAPSFGLGYSNSNKEIKKED